MGGLAVAALAASMFGVVRTVDQVVWGQAYKPHVVQGTMTGTSAQTLAGYGAEGARFRPVTDRIFGH